VHLVGYIKRIYHDARSPERQNIYVALSWMCAFRTVGVNAVLLLSTMYAYFSISLSYAISVFRINSSWFFGQQRHNTAK